MAIRAKRFTEAVAIAEARGLGIPASTCRINGVWIFRYI